MLGVNTYMITLFLGNFHIRENHQVAGLTTGFRASEFSSNSTRPGSLNILGPPRHPETPGEICHGKIWHFYHVFLWRITTKPMAKPMVFRCQVYPLVNVYIAMENHHFSWENPLFLWSFSIAMLNYQRVSGIPEFCADDTFTP